MTQTQLESAIRTRFKTLVADVHKTIPVQYDNTELDTKTRDKAAAFITWSIRPGERYRVDLGNPTSRYRTPGIAIASIFVKAGSGTSVSSAIQDTVMNAFLSTTASGVVYQTPTPTVVGESDGFWQVNVICPFYSDSII